MLPSGASWRMSPYSNSSKGIFMPVSGSVSAVVTDKAHQPIARDISLVPHQGATEGAYPVEIGFALPTVRECINKNPSGKCT